MAVTVMLNNAEDLFLNMSDFNRERGGDQTSGWCLIFQLYQAYADFANTGFTARIEKIHHAI